MSPKIPRHRNALVATGPGELAMKRVPMPTIEPNQILVKTSAVALNPSDYKLLDQSTTVGAISGSDFAGTVVKVGDGVDVSKLKVGDRVFGCVFGANPADPSSGAFGSYVAATADLCLHMPDAMPFANATSLGMGIMTVGLIFRSLGLEVRETGLEEVEQEKPYVLVHGGATATGTLAIQILKFAGYRPITTCSAKNFDLVAARGAVAAFDYNSPTCKDEIKKYTQGRLAHAVDCIGNVATMTLCYSAIGDAGGRYVALEQYPRRLSIRRRNVKHEWVLGWTLFGKPVKLAGAYARPAIPEDLVFGNRWRELMQPLLNRSMLVPHPLEAHSGGLAALIPRVDLLRKGKVSGKKLVFLV
ncbi:hypothetical protein JMJ35_001048 [Cladonia borealis]|uniref:Enoyl reductase (ER) domain-containing protein n=1 Tax=Cladonia borealis TaxID=184061 RepID=A0AA39R7U8_9LECA|nr:hypothetical protein JMJ35_001048 [Cladonia borealis]